MDTITHALAGAAISDCWFRERLGRYATPFALLVGALPDIDAVTYLVSPETAWANHRGYTHAFFIMLLAAPLLGGVGWLLSRDKRERRDTNAWKWWTVLAAACLFCHTLMDLITSWGTMPLLPFSNARISWDMAPILDAFITSVLAASFLVNRLLRWEKVETFLNPIAYPIVHKHPRRRRAADIAARITAALVVVYLLIGLHQNFQTVRIARKELAAAGIEATEVRALPLMFTYVSWGIAARDADGTVYNALYSTYSPKPMRFVRHQTTRDGGTERALRTRDGALFAWYSQNFFVAAEERSGDGRSTVRLSDRRFFTLGEPDRPRFVMELVEETPGGAFEAKPTQMRFADIDIRDEMRKLWDLTRYGEVNPDAASVPDQAGR